MNSAKVALPSISRIAATLRLTTEILARELAIPTNETPHWTSFEWRLARAVAAMHGISSLLYVRLCWEGPASWRRFLHEQRDQSMKRHIQISNLLDEIDSEARREGVALAALKGAALQSSSSAVE